MVWHMGKRQRKMSATNIQEIQAISIPIGSRNSGRTKLRNECSRMPGGSLSYFTRKQGSTNSSSI